MTSATLFREGLDLDELLADLEEEHPGRVRVVDVTYGRDGGVLGFFARRTVGVRYRVVDEAAGGDLDGYRGGRQGAAEAAAYGLGDDTGPLAELLRAADAREMVESGRVPAQPAGEVEGNLEFARMLLEMAASKAAEKAAQDSVRPTATVPSATAPVAAPAAAPAAAPRLTPAPLTAFAVLPPPVAVAPPAPPAAPSVSPAFAPWSVPSQPVPTPATFEPAPAAPVPAPVPLAPAPVVPAQRVDIDPDLTELLRRARTRPVGAHRADGGPPDHAPADHGPADQAAAACAAPIVSPAAVPAPAVPPATFAAPTGPAHRAPEPAQPVPAHHTPEAAQPLPIRTVPAPADAAPAPVPPSRTAPDLPGQYALRRQLVELGVPVSWIPDHAADPYQVVRELVGRLPEAALGAPRPGELLVVVGTAAEALRIARRVCATLRIDPDTSLHAAGCAGPAGGTVVNQPWEAARLAAEVRYERRGPAVVAVATDGPDGDTDEGWAAAIVAALAPEQLWLAVDAGHKPADLRATVTRFGTVSALVVSGVERTASPASVWELGTPVAMLDGRRATPGAWTALLIDKLAELDT